jgi:hypothetical protein
MESSLHCNVFLALVSSYGEMKWISRHDSLHDLSYSKCDVDLQRSSRRGDYLCSRAIQVIVVRGHIVL